MKEEILVSIIIPVYKAEKYIKDCIESLINQTYSNLEIIFVLDGITDNSKKIIEEYINKDNRIILLEKENTGALDSRKEGLKIARGQYIMFVDADDWIKTETIQEMLEIALKYNVDIVKAGMIKELKKSKTYLKITDKELEYISKKDFEKTIYNEILSTFKHNAMVMQLIKKDVINIEKIEKGLVFGEDLSFNMELYSNINDIVLLSKCYYYYRYNENSVTRKSDLNSLNKHIEDILFLTNKSIDYIEKWKIKDENIIKNVYIYLLTRISLYAFKIFNIEKNKEKHKKFFREILEKEEVKHLKAQIELSEIKNLKTRSKIFMILIYKGNIKSILTIGKFAYKLSIFKSKIKEKYNKRKEVKWKKSFQ